MSKTGEYSDWTNEDLIREIKRLKEIKYGLVWHEDLPENILGVTVNPDSTTASGMLPEDVSGKLFPVLEEAKTKSVHAKGAKQTHVLIEGNNFHSLAALNFTHHESVDVIYIDPPYNTGKKYDFKFNDSWVIKEDGYRHSKWLCFMNRRLRLGKELLKDTGVIIAHIDENEVDNLYLLLCEIFEEKNDLGRIIWNKCNPKGDSKGVSILHETILCFAKNKEKFLSLNNVLERAKQNAEKIIAKAKSLHKKIGKNEIPSDVNDAISPFKYPENLKEQFKVQYDLELINKEFKKWLKVQGFSGGEAAYKFIDENGDAYRGFPLTWPSKGKKAPEKYFKPLLHPKTNKKCPVPERGWRNPPETMHKLREQGLLLFGPDEKKQPELKGLLKDNMSENTPSMFSYSGSDDDLFKSLKLDFEFAKPLWVAKYIIKSVHPSPRIVLDFFAGSGTTGHAVLELNNDDDVQGMQFILCTDNENEICADICYPRLKKVIKGYSDKDQNPVPALPANLKYYKTSFVEASPTDKNKHLLVQNSTELLCLRENAFDLVSDDSFLKVFKGESMHIGILFDEDEICRLQKVITDTPGFFNLYIFSLANDSYEDYFREYKKRVQICSIPEVILKVYREIFG